MRRFLYVWKIDVGFGNGLFGSYCEFMVRIVNYLSFSYFSNKSMKDVYILELGKLN